MWVVFMFLNLWSLHCTVSTSPPSPINVSFSSVNLRNVLHWFPGNGTSDDTLFTVEYAIYGDSVEGSKGRRAHWRAARQCTEIVRTWCDLSNETWDPEQGYYARVRAVGTRASSKWAFTRRRFDPKSDTSFGPPLMSVEIENNSAIVTLKGPMRYRPNTHTPELSMATLYSYMAYNLSIHNTRRNQMHHFQVVTSPYKYRLMEYKTEYCFSAQSRFFSMPAQCQSSAWHCITTPQDPVIEQLQRVVVGIAVPVTCICLIVVAGYLLHHYLTGRGQKSPYMLTLPSFHPPPLIFPLESPNHILISIIKDVPPPDPECPSRQLPIADLPPSYSPQRPETPSEPEEPWDDVSIDYGFISAAPKIISRGEEQETRRRPDEGDERNNLKDEHQKRTARESYKETEWRVEDGLAAGVHAPQVNCYLSQKSIIPIRTQVHAHTDVSTLAQARARSQVNSAYLTQTQAPLQSFQESTTGEVNRTEEDREPSGLFESRKKQTGLFHAPLALQTIREAGREEDMDGKMRVRTEGKGKIDEGVEEGSRCENEPLLSAYASQNFKSMSTSHSDQSEYLSNDYGVLRLAVTQEAEGDYCDEEEAEEGTICVNWDPETRKLVLPEMGMGLDGLMHSEKGREDRIGGEDEEAYVKKGELMLENVFVRQASEEEAEAWREQEKGWEAGWKADILTKWNLVISMDQ